MNKMKICKDCKDPHPIEDFKEREYFREKGRSYKSRDCRCTECRLKYQREAGVRKREKARKLAEELAAKPVSPLIAAYNKFLY